MPPVGGTMFEDVLNVKVRTEAEPTVEGAKLIATLVRAPGMAVIGMLVPI